jgi:hypothetical protein
VNRRETLTLLGIGVLACRRAVAAPPVAEPRGKPVVLSKAFKECLGEVYDAEVFGETLFGEMLQVARNPAETYLIGSMLQLETEGKATLRPLLTRLGLSMCESGEAHSSGSANAAKLNKLPWQERFETIRGSIEKVFLPRYLALADLVSKEQDAEAARIAVFMGTHERAILAAATGAAAGAPDPAAPMTKLLRFPLERP